MPSGVANAAAAFVSDLEDAFRQATHDLVQGAGAPDPTSPDPEDVYGALNDLAVRLSEAAETLRQLVQMAKPDASVDAGHLTARELVVLDCLADGKGNSEIAKACWISENTVKFHLRNIFRKLDVRDRGQAMMIARGRRQSAGRP